MTDRKIVIWGAGRIGRGFIADLFDAAGYRITLVDSSAELVERLRAVGRYTVVRAWSPEQYDERTIRGFTALHSSQVYEAAVAIAEAGLVAVAVFPAAFAEVARGLAPGVAHRLAQSPGAALDILMCTNLLHAAAQFRELLLAALPLEIHEEAAGRLGVVDTLVIRTATEPPLEAFERDPLLVWTNGFPEFPIDRRAFEGIPVQIAGVRLVENMEAEEMRKLYTYNMLHAMLAYLGVRRGHTLTVQCMADPEIRGAAEGALDEVSRALQAEWGFTAGEMAAWIALGITFTDNPLLVDRVARHGADPRRKLRRDDRLVGPALLARKHGIPPVFLVRGIAGALLYDRPGDEGAAYVQSRIAELGLAPAVRELCGFTAAEEDLVQMILSAYRRCLAGTWELTVPATATRQGK
jgi:mannitol-1-phosphate 5-dehydrogenase